MLLLVSLQTCAHLRMVTPGTWWWWGGAELLERGGELDYVATVGHVKEGVCSWW